MHRRIWLYAAAAALLAALALYAGAAEAEDAPERPAVSYAALTFDDSPNGAKTERLLDGLRQRGAKATFFIIGEQIAGNEALLRRMADEGHQLGNHTYTHRRLDVALDVGEEELRRTDEALRAVVGPGEYWVRPPWGFAARATLQRVRVPLIYWSVDTEDWNVRDADAIADRLSASLRDGDVVLLHDAYDESVDAALRAIDLLQARGFRFVTLRELFAHMGVEPEAGRLYSRPDALRSVP